MHCEKVSVHLFFLHLLIQYPDDKMPGKVSFRSCQTVNKLLFENDRKNRTRLAQACATVIKERVNKTFNL